MATKKEKVVGGVKIACALVSNGAAQAFVCGIGRALLPPGVNAMVQGAMFVGGLMLGGFAGDKLSEHMNGVVDNVVETVEDKVSEIKRCIDVIQDKEETKE